MAEAVLDDVFADDITFPAKDGYSLGGPLFLPRGAKRHAVLLNSATAVPRQIYKGFTSYGPCAYPTIHGRRAPAVDLLCLGFTSIRPDVDTIAPSNIGAARIGHFGFFRSQHRDTLWRGAAEWLEEMP